MRDLVVFAVIVAVVPVALLRPWIGVLLWSWISYMNPHRLTWGFSHNMPFAKIAAVATLVGLLLSGERKRLPRTATVTLLAAFWIWITLTTLGANYPELAWPEWVKVSKFMLITFVTMFLFQEIRKIRYFLLTVALSIAFYGVKSGIAGLLKGFSSMVYSYPPASFIDDNNSMALALNMVIPLLLLLAQEEKRPLLKYAFYAISGLTVLGVLSTFSRGGFIGLGVTILTVVLFSRRRAAGAILLVLGGLFVASMASDILHGRITSISEYRQDRSAQSRIEAWTVATKLALESPLSGGGFRVLQPEMYSRYGYDTAGKERVAHSIFFQVLSEQGFVGFGIFLALIGSAFISLRRVSRMSAVNADLNDLGKIARAIQTSVIAYVVSGAFLSHAYFDLFYHLIAIAAVLAKLANEQISGISEVKEQV